MRATLSNPSRKRKRPPKGPVLALGVRLYDRTTAPII